jgi:hypothetical protein
MNDIVRWASAIILYIFCHMHPEQLSANKWTIQLSWHEYLFVLGLTLQHYYKSYSGPFIKSGLSPGPWTSGSVGETDSSGRVEAHFFSNLEQTPPSFWGLRNFLVSITKASLCGNALCTLFITVACCPTTGQLLKRAAFMICGWPMLLK